MKAANFFMSAIHLLVVMLIVGIGSFFVFLYFYPNILFFFINHVIDQPQVILKVGFFTLFLALLLFYFFYLMNRSQYLKYVMGSNKVQIDAKIIKNYIQDILKDSFEDDSDSYEINIHPKNKLEIIALVDSLDNKKEFLVNLEKKVAKFLLKNFNYKEEFIFTLKSKK